MYGTGPSQEYTHMNYYLAPKRQLSLAASPQPLNTSEAMGPQLRSSLFDPGAPNNSAWPQALTPEIYFCRLLFRERA